MTIQRFKLALNAARFPLVSTKGQRAVFVPALDSAPRTPRTFMGSDESVDYNLTQLVYGENFMPVSEGLHSVGYRQQIAPSVNTDFDQIFALRDDQENTVLYSPANGKNYIYDDVAAAWTTTSFLDIHGVVIDPASPNTEESAKVTYAYVDGKTFVCYSRLLATGVPPTEITGTFDSVGTVTLTVLFESVTYTLGIDPELTNVDDTWTLDITGIITVYGSYPVVATATDIVPTATVVNSTVEFGGTDASILFWDPTTKTLEPAGALISNLIFDAGAIDGIASSNGFLVVYSDLTVAWAPFNGTAFDFTIYANNEYTGAGYQIPEDIQGVIKAVIAVSGGFIMFTSKNAIGANYHAQNIQAPWVFKEVPGAGGIESYEQATIEGSLGYVMAHTTTGLQKLSLNSSEDMFPDVSDFISGRYIERYSFPQHQLREAATNLDMYVKLATIANRYTVVSYGTFPGVYSFALVFDHSLRRWGKLRMVHRDCFYYSFGTYSADLTYSMLGDIPYDSPELTTYDDTTQQSSGIITAPHGLAFLKDTGEVVIANWSNQARETPDEAVVIIGRIQLTRSSHTQFNRAEIEGLVSGTALLQPSYNGKTLEAAEELVVIESEPNYKVVGGLIDCRNFNFVVEGTFDLSTIIIEATTSGKM